MSQWTHVAGIIRIDSMVAVMNRGEPDPTEKMLRERLGYTWDFDDLSNRARDTHIDNSDVPFGSEGSVQYDIVQTGSQSSLSWGHIVIWGDLRDFDDPNKIYDWLLNSLATINEDGMGFRDVIVSIVVERSNQYIIFQDDQDDGEIRMSVSQAKIQ